MFLHLEYEQAIASLGREYYDVVKAAKFPRHLLRWRNDLLLPLLGLNASQVSDRDFIQAFGEFEAVCPFLALRYHGYQFGQYNPQLGDGRGFLYGQVRGIDGNLYDFGTKGSGPTPYSRGGDGRLTLKGGVREVLAAEALHRLGVNTSRCLSLIETGESLWRGDEPSPTRAAVMVRLSRSHIRFGTFERLHHYKQPELIKKLLDHVIHYYYAHLESQPDRYASFFQELVDRTARLVAQWMQAGFCHAVLNTDNMSITGESFDYGPYAFIPNFDLNFTAAYFDCYGRYAYGNQPGICKWNLEMLARTLDCAIAPAAMEASLASYEEIYWQEYSRLMLGKLGLPSLDPTTNRELVITTCRLLHGTPIGYHEFFWRLGQLFQADWQHGPEYFPAWTEFADSRPPEIYPQWVSQYRHALQGLAAETIATIPQYLKANNPKTALLRPTIESVWLAIDQADNWQPFYDLVATLQAGE